MFVLCATVAKRTVEKSWFFVLYKTINYVNLVSALRTVVTASATLPGTELPSIQKPSQLAITSSVVGRYDSMRW